MTKKSLTCAAAILAGGAILATTATASASSTDCTKLKNPVYMAGASATLPHVLAIAAALKTNGVTPLPSIIYAEPSACIGLQDVTTSQTEASSALYIDPSTSPPSEVTCTGSGTNPYPPIYIDVGVSGAYPSSCINPAITLGSGYSDFQGPIQVNEFAVPYASTQFSISAAAAYTVFGWGGTMYGVTPWTVPNEIFSRGDTSGVELVIANAIGLLASKWGTDTGDSGAAQVLSKESLMVSTLEASTNANATIGILSSGGLDPVKMPGGLKPLAFEATDQDCGYYADSNLSTFDKINVRQGRYDIWGPEHFVAAVNGSGAPQPNPKTSSNPVPSTAADIAAVLNYVTHAGITSATQLQTIIAGEAGAFVIPQCAMQVTRTSEDGAEMSSQPTGACGCFFEAATGSGSTLSSYCTKCTSSTTCTTAPYTSCNYGYCEAP